jgi:hypothetical protein
MAHGQPQIVVDWWRLAPHLTQPVQTCETNQYRETSVSFHEHVVLYHSIGEKRAELKALDRWAMIDG